ncbi:MAG: cadherin-like domain-containing protein [Pseudomonadota bacterium]
MGFEHTRQKNTVCAETFDFSALAEAVDSGALSAPSGGRRARRRAIKSQLSKGGFLLPLLAAQGCLSLGKQDALLAGADSGSGSSDNVQTGASGGRSAPPLQAVSDEFVSVPNETIQLDVADILANDTVEGASGLELVRVFDSVNGTAMLEGAIINFIPDEDFEGLASFVYEIRDASGNISTATVELHIAPEGEDGGKRDPTAGNGDHDRNDEEEGGDHGGGHGDDDEDEPHGDGHDDDDGPHGGGHPHPDDPDLAGEHMALLDLVPVADATHIAVNNGSWFDPNTWAGGEVPGEGAAVLIPEGMIVEYDGEDAASLFTVRVDGKLDFATDQNTFMEVDTFIVSPSGHVTIGTLDDPVSANVQTTIQIADNGPIDTAWDPLLFSRGFLSHGTIEVHGAQKDAFLRLAEDPLAGDTSLTLEAPPEGWQVGDRLVLTGTKFGSIDNTGDRQRDIQTEDEELVITAIDGNVIHFADPLQYDHDTPRDDLKAYVANYSRNVQIVTENADELPAHQRGHVMFLHSDDIDVRYAEFTDLGRTDKSERAFDPDDVDVIEADTNLKGRYSLHIHRAGVSDQDDPAMLVGNAVWGSPGWGYVHHDSNAILADNAAYDTFGAAFVAETGNETGRWVGNIAIRQDGVSGINDIVNNPKLGEDVLAFDLGRNGTGFWFQGRLVDAVDNVAAGSPGGHGFTYFHRGPGQISVTRDLLNDGDILNYRSVGPVNNPHISQFEGNESIGVGVGLLIVKANALQEHDERSFISDFTAWEVRRGAHLEYTSHYTLEDFDLVAAEGEWTEWGITTGTGIRDFVINGARIDGFEVGVLSESGFHPDEDRNYFFIDVEVLNNTGAAIDNTADFDRILTSADLSSLPGAGDLSFTSDFPTIARLGEDIPLDFAYNFSGVREDALGRFNVGEVDRIYLRVPDVNRVIAEEGYWSLPDGRQVTAFESVHADRLTGEIIKTAQFFEIDSNFNYAEQWGAVYHGELDLFSAAPNAVTDIVTIDIGGRVTIDVLANDSDPDGDRLNIDGIGEARHGSVWVTDDGRVVYEADPNFSGTDEFTYWVEDDNGNFSQGTVQVTVEA